MTKPWLVKVGALSIKKKVRFLTHLLVTRRHSFVSEALRCVRDFNLHNQEISQNCNILIIIKLLQINYITKYH